MEDEDEINIKLELNKYKNQNLSILTYFNPNSSNFFKEGDYYIWKPTLKEKEFIIDAFRLIINSNSEKNEVENIFKFSDKISGVNEESKKINNLHSGSNETNDEEIIQHCKRYLPTLKVPKEIKIVKFIPKTHSGKLLRKELRNKISNK